MQRLTINLMLLLLCVLSFLYLISIDFLGFFFFSIITLAHLDHMQSTSIIDCNVKTPNPEGRYFCSQIFVDFCNGTFF